MVLHEMAKFGRYTRIEIRIAVTFVQASFYNTWSCNITLCPLEEFFEEYHECS